MPKFKSYKKNQFGRDFICSDIHGHFYLLDEKLAEVNFDTERDRLFCLGDLIDRSEDSVNVLDYLKCPWFYSILGNHEVMLIDVVQSGDPDVARQWYSWGGDWAENLSIDDLEVYSQAFANLPITIELELDKGYRIGLVHASLPNKTDWNKTRRILHTVNNTKYVSDDALLWEMLWSKAPLDNAKAIKPVANIDHVFHGHTIVNEITTIGNRTYMDLGSYNRFKLGFIQADAYLDKLKIKPLSDF